MKRTYNTETIKNIGEKVKVYGWIQTIRSHGKIIFVDLRDISGILQLVFYPQNKIAYNLSKELGAEWVIEAVGKINKRPEKMINPKIKTGNIELEVETLKVLNKSKTLPFEITSDTKKINEELRLKYRYLDLRSERMRNNIIQRNKISKFVRDYMINEGFIEIETPFLTKSTPEGARDFIVPSRLYPGKFYALPQSPQQYKQLLMVAGFEKYFQIVRCFRDEDPRADRQPEFAQLDVEMSFVSQEDILNLVEKLHIELIKKLFPQKKIKEIPFPRLPYKEVMEKYNSDRPDLRKNKKDPDELAFAFIVNFPMFEWKKSENRWDAVHHPFTRPQSEDIKEIKNNPDKILAHQYDLVLNGYEIGGGSLRTHRPDVLEAVFEVMGHKKKEIQEKFGHLLEAFKYGVPPHGGIALGFDRLVSTILNEPSIREVIAFPKTGDSRDLMMNSPAEVSKEQLEELHIKIVKPKN